MHTKLASADKYFGHYHLTREFASSSSSRILLGEDCSPGVSHLPVAVKWFYTTHMQAQPEKHYFLRDLHIIQNLHHSHILTILSVGFHDDTPYIVMEYAPQPSLYDRLQDALPLPQDEAFTILTQIGEALYHAHQHDVLHGNLKPQNILFNAAGEALLADFHPRSIPIEPVPTGTNTPETFVYRTLAQLAGPPGKESDQFTFACIAYEMLTGRKPFMMASQSHPGTYFKAKTLIAPRRLNPDLSQQVEEALLKALAKDPAQRHSNISAFLTASGISIKTTRQHTIQTLSVLPPEIVSSIVVAPAAEPLGPVETFIPDTITSFSEPLGPIEILTPTTSIDFSEHLGPIEILTPTTSTDFPEPLGPIEILTPTTTINLAELLGPVEILTPNTATISIEDRPTLVQIPIPPSPIIKDTPTLVPVPPSSTEDILTFALVLPSPTLMGDRPQRQLILPASTLRQFSQPEQRLVHLLPYSSSTISLKDAIRDREKYLLRAREWLLAASAACTWTIASLLAQSKRLLRSLLASSAAYIPVITNLLAQYKQMLRLRERLLAIIAASAPIITNIRARGKPILQSWLLTFAPVITNTYVKSKHIVDSLLLASAPIITSILTKGKHIVQSWLLAASTVCAPIITRLLSEGQQTLQSHEWLLAVTTASTPIITTIRARGKHILQSHKWLPTAIAASAMVSVIMAFLFLTPHAPGTGHTAHTPQIHATSITTASLTRTRGITSSLPPKPTPTPRIESTSQQAIISQTTNSTSQDTDSSTSQQTGSSTPQQKSSKKSPVSTSLSRSGACNNTIWGNSPACAGPSNWFKKP